LCRYEREAFYLSILVSVTFKRITALYLYILYLSSNMYTAVLHILGDVDSMNRSWHHFYVHAVYSLQYGEVSSSCDTNQDSQRTYSVTLGRVRASNVAVEKQRALHNLSVCICSLRYPACNARAPYCYMWPVPLYKLFPHYLINGTNLEKKKLRTNLCLA
jgi:hypothetical protein